MGCQLWCECLGGAATWFPAPVRQVLQFERVTPEPGADADPVGHEFVAQVDRRRGRRCWRSTGSPRSGTCSSTATVVASGRSMFERARGARGGRGQRGAGRRAPAHRAPRRGAHASRGSAGGRWWSRSRGCAGCAPSCSGERRASRPDRRWSGRTARSRWSPARARPGPAEPGPGVEGRHGRGRGRRRRPASRSPTSSPGGRTPTARPRCMT